MKKNILILLLAFVGIVAQAQIPNGYYNNANGKTGDELKVALHNIIKGHHAVSYGGLLDAYAYTDCDANGKIWDIYSNYHYNLNQNGSNFPSEGTGWNREHTWPQSWFNEQSTPRTDLFHVYPTDGYVNGQRSSYPYGEVSNPTYTSGNGSKLGPCVTTGYSGTVFEPIDEYKGDIARSYFYMSVRYYSEDDSWIATDMTNKSVIKDWAMTMLLRWSDNDPVSEKEIARNNAVFGYQGNRNPFIDHPEYARMIWDPNYTPATSYNITYASNLSDGSVSGPSSAAQGSTVAIVATPNAGYQVSGYSVYKTGDQGTAVTVSSNGTFTMPGYAVTVSATFAPNNTYYNIALGSVSHGNISASTNSAKSGTTINLTATPDSGYSLYSWYVFKTGDMNNTVAVNGNSFVMPAFNVTVSASFVQPSSYTYVKVTEAPTDWSGEYLIVYEGGSKAFNGGLTSLDATNNTISVTINDNKIASTTNTDAAKFTIAKSGNSYTIKSASGYYIGRDASSNGLNANQTTQYLNTLGLDANNNTVITGAGGYQLRFNSNSNDMRFRYYNGTQQPIQLYKKTSNASAPTHTIQFNKNGGTGSMSNQTVNEFEATALNTCAFTYANHLFDGWNTQANGSGDYYADGAMVSLLNDLTLYAQWEPLYSVTISNTIEHGSVTANVNQAIEEQTITLTATPDSGYEFDHWTVTDALNNSILVTENQFEMPASNVTVSATFVQQSTPSVTQYVKVTTAPDDWSGEYILVYESSETSAYVWTGVDAANCYVSKDIVDGNTIENDDTFVTLTVASMSGGYSIQVNGGSNDGKYIYGTADKNEIKFGNTASLNTLDYETNSVKITSNTSVMRYNSSATVFRYYKSSSYSSQQPIQLYKKVSGTTPDPGTPFEVSYHLVTSTDQLVAGRTYLIVNESANKALSKTQNTNNRASTAVAISNHTISELGDACELLLGEQSGKWTLYDATNNSGYLYAASSGSNYLKTQTTNDANGQWAISIASNGDATITAQGSNTHNIIRYNSSNNPPIFSCYTSGQQPVQLYIRSEEIPITQNTTEANIFPFDKHIVRSGTILTVTGTVTCDDPNNLIIEDGGQFIHHNDGVKATFKKGVEAFTNNETSDGWYTIATPFATYSPSQITTDAYDLYYYDEDGPMEWINYKGSNGNFNLNGGQGYLYAHNPTTTLCMTGTLNNGDYSQTVNLSYANSDETIKGFNLLGNPTAHDITFTRKTSDISDGYYYVSNGDAWIYTTNSTVPAGRGFLVKANATNQRVELNPSSKREAPQVEGQYLCVNVDGEKAYVKMNEGVSMPLFYFNGNSSNLYLTHEGKPYVMLVRDGAESIDLNYHSSHKGQHSLSVAAEDLGLDYLHLIDRLTGADIDLLATPTYSFESEKHDYDTRFLLQFAPANNDVINGDFAYYADGQIHILDVTDSSTLQIVDLTGRVIVSRDGACTISTAEMTPGVYTLRLITPDNIRTQKIIVMK